MCTETFLRLPEEKRNRFLDAAWEEFTAVPYTDVSINKIVRRARIPRGSFYQYFTDKTDLFAYLLNDIRDHFAQSFAELLTQAEGDIFRVQLLAYDSFIQRREEDCSPQLDRMIRLLRVNVGLDLEKLTSGLPGKPLEVLLDRLDASRLRRQDPEFARRVFSMATLNLGTAMMDSLTKPERSAEYRQELVERLEIIKYGSLRPDCLKNPA
nr:TetR/AcrR family transcriptional regulator [uncultured Dysosmobacter sp.]